jgi:hypothetical protein
MLWVRVRGWVRREWHLVVLAGWAAAWFVILAPGGGVAWHFFVQGTSLLFTGHDGASTRPAGLDLFASYPSLQIGPVAYPVAQVLRQIGPDNGVVAAEILMTALGLAVFAMAQRIVTLARPDLAGLDPERPGRARPGPDGMPRRLRVVLLVAGALFVIAWQELAVGYAHLDDSLALTCVVAAVWACLSGRLAVCGALIGLAGASKPWALGYLPVLALPVLAPAHPRRGIVAGLRARVPAVAGFAVVTLACWLPFFAADSATANAMHYKIANMPDSALRALGVAAASTPSWDRPAQILIGCVLGAIAIARGRWPAVVLFSAGARIALDPGVHGYYTPEVMAGALLWDLIGARRPLPVWSVVSFGALNLAPLLTKDAALLGEVRLWLVIAFTVVVLLGPAAWYWHPPRRDAPGRAGQPGQPGQQRAPAPDAFGPAACAAGVPRLVAWAAAVADAPGVLARLVAGLLDGAPSPPPAATG